MGRVQLKWVSVGSVDSRVGSNKLRFSVGRV